MGSFITGLLGGFGEALGTHRKENLDKEARQQELELKTLQTLAEFGDDETRALAVAGMLEASQPRRRGKSFVQRLLGSPQALSAFEQLQALQAQRAGGGGAALDPEAGAPPLPPAPAAQAPAPPPPVGTITGQGTAPISPATLLPGPGAPPPQPAGQAPGNFVQGTAAPGAAPEIAAAPSPPPSLGPALIASPAQHAGGIAEAQQSGNIVGVYRGMLALGTPPEEARAVTLQQFGKRDPIERMSAEAKLRTIEAQAAGQPASPRDAQLAELYDLQHNLAIDPETAFKAEMDLKEKLLGVQSTEQHQRVTESLGAATLGLQQAKFNYEKAQTAMSNPEVLEGEVLTALTQKSLASIPMKDRRAVILQMSKTGRLSGLDKELHEDLQRYQGAETSLEAAGDLLDAYEAISWSSAWDKTMAWKSYATAVDSFVSRQTGRGVGAEKGVFTTPDQISFVKQLKPQILGTDIAAFKPEEARKRMQVVMNMVLANKQTDVDAAAARLEGRIPTRTTGPKWLRGAKPGSPTKPPPPGTRVENK